MAAGSVKWDNARINRRAVNVEFKRLANCESGCPDSHSSAHPLEAKPIPHGRLLRARSLFHSGVADENYVARLNTADEEERAPVGRPVEGDNLLGLETGQLSWGPPVERLEPDVIETVGAVSVGN